MSSQLDWEYLQIMREIEAKSSELSSPSQSASIAPVQTVGRRISPVFFALVIGLVLSVLFCIYAAYLAGFFGKVDGHRGLWRDAYLWKAAELDATEKLLSNKTRQLSHLQADCDRWAEMAKTFSNRLSGLEGELDDERSVSLSLRSKCQILQLQLNSTIERREALQEELERQSELAERWEGAYRSAQASLECLQARYADLASRYSNATQALRSSDDRLRRLENQLHNATIQLAKTRIQLSFYKESLEEAEERLSDLQERFEELDHLYRDLACRLKLLQLNLSQWRDLYEAKQKEIDHIMKHLRRCRSLVSNLTAELEQKNRQNEELERLRETLQDQLEQAERDVQWWRSAFEEANRSLVQANASAQYWRARCENLSVLLSQIEWQRDHWIALYEEVSRRLAECQEQREYWRQRFQVLQTELDEERANTAYWQKLYQELAGVYVNVTLGNVTVLERKSGLPSKVSVDITVWASTIQTPILLILEYWAEPTDCIYGYGSLAEDISTWPRRWKTFSVILDFKRGLSSYKVVATASLRPINGYDQGDVCGPP